MWFPLRFSEAGCICDIATAPWEQTTGCWCLLCVPATWTPLALSSVSSHASGGNVVFPDKELVALKGGLGKPFTTLTLDELETLLKVKLLGVGSRQVR